MSSSLHAVAQIFASRVSKHRLLSPEQLDAYTTTLRIEGITLKLHSNNSVPAGRRRCPSPEPEYDCQGRRIKTREQRCRLALADELHALVDETFKTIPKYSPPSHYKLPTSFATKVFAPIADYPGVNYIGKILGPRGSSLKALNKKKLERLLL